MSGFSRGSKAPLLLWNKRIRTYTIVQVFGKIRIWTEELVGQRKTHVGGQDEVRKGIWETAHLAAVGPWRRLVEKSVEGQLPQDFACAIPLPGTAFSNPPALFHHIFPVYLDVTFSGHQFKIATQPSHALFCTWFSSCYLYFKTLYILLIYFVYFSSG